MQLFTKINFSEKIIIAFFLPYRATPPRQERSPTSPPKLAYRQASQSRRVIEEGYIRGGTEYARRYDDGRKERLPRGQHFEELPSNQMGLYVDEEDEGLPSPPMSPFDYSSQRGRRSAGEEMPPPKKLRFDDEEESQQVENHSQVEDREVESIPPPASAAAVTPVSTSTPSCPAPLSKPSLVAAATEGNASAQGAALDGTTKSEYERVGDNEVIHMGSFVTPGEDRSDEPPQALRWSFGRNSTQFGVVLGMNTRWKVNKKKSNFSKNNYHVKNKFLPK